MKTETSPIDVLKYIDRLDKDFLQSIVKPKYEGGNNNIDADLIIFVRRRDDRQTMYSFSEIGKIASTSDDRVIVGYMIYNDLYDYDSNYDVDYNHREYLLTVIFMHEIIHFLGFDSEILKKKGLIRQKSVESRIKKNVSYFYKFIVINQEVLNFAEKYFGETITEIEFNEKSNSEDLSESHWEGRLLLGDIMTLDLYYTEVVISEFTLKFLEQLGWY